MKKIIKLLLIIFLISINITYLKADCESDKEVASSLSIEEYNYIKDDKNVVGFELIGGNENLYIKLYNNYTDDTNRYSFKDEILSYYYKYIDTDMLLKLDVYSNACGEEVLNSFTVRGDKLNAFSELAVCDKLVGASVLCNPHYDIGDMTEEEFINEVNKDTRVTKFKLSFTVGLKRYYILAIIPVFVIGFGYAIAIYVMNYKRKKTYMGGNK